ncbi:MAG: hypothetical protein JWQ89_3740, partial [Devosia sp.]|nr:hypothetical protein [Devosia sp.]
FAGATGVVGAVFRRALEKYYDGMEDPLTVELLGENPD